MLVSFSLNLVQLVKSGPTEVFFAIVNVSPHDMDFINHTNPLLWCLCNQIIIENTKNQILLNRWPHSSRISCDYALPRRDSSTTAAASAGRAQTCQSPWDMWGHNIGHSAITKSHCAHSRGWREKEGMGPALDHQRFPGYWETAVNVRGQILCRWWDLISWLLSGATSIQCKKVWSSNIAAWNFYL